MSQVDPIPPDHILEERRKPRYIIDPKDVSQKDDLRVRAWAAEVIKKHEHKLSAPKFKNRQIVVSGYVEPESIDIANIYPFNNLHWIIFRNDHNKSIMWSIALLSGRRLLFISTFAKI